MLNHVISLLENLFQAAQDQFGSACAVLLIFVLPVLVPVALVADLDRDDLAAGFKRGFKVLGIFLVAAGLSCLLSVIFQALFNSFLGGFGLGFLHVAVVGLALFIMRIRE